MWQVVDQLLPGLINAPLSSQSTSESDQTLSSTRRKLDAALFLVRRQKFLELLERQQTKQALLVLRHEITPMAGVHAEQLHVLSRYIAGRFFIYKWQAG
jgi:membrane-associated PAP2 superfamily phosphatase